MPRLPPGPSFAFREHGFRDGRHRSDADIRADTACEPSAPSESATPDAMLATHSERPTRRDSQLRRRCRHLQAQAPTGRSRVPSRRLPSPTRRTSLPRLSWPKIPRMAVHRIMPTLRRLRARVCVVPLSRRSISTNDLARSHSPKDTAKSSCAHRKSRRIAFRLRQPPRRPRLRRNTARPACRR